MSELAYNLQGERFQPPATTTNWRVRRLKPGGRGTPDVVFSKDGAPLMLPLETELSDFRLAVANHPGRYRLDPVTEDHRASEGGQPAYLYLSEHDDTAQDVAVDARSGGGAPEDLLRDLVRANTDLVRNITDKFASVMDSAAGLIRAADGAGLPARDPMGLPLQPVGPWRNAEPTNDEEEDDDELADDHMTLASVLQTTIDRAMPLVNHAVNTKVLGLSAEQSIALMGGNVGAASTKATAQTPQKRSADGPAAPPSSPKPAADFMPHLLAIEAQLSADDSTLARAAVAQMPPAAVAAWREKLLGMSPTDAAEMIRAEVNKPQAEVATAAEQKTQEAA